MEHNVVIIILYSQQWWYFGGPSFRGTILHHNSFRGGYTLVEYETTIFFIGPSLPEKTQRPPPSLFQKARPVTKKTTCTKTTNGTAFNIRTGGTKQKINSIPSKYGTFGSFNNGKLVDNYTLLVPWMVWELNRQKQTNGNGFDPNRRLFEG